GSLCLGGTFILILVLYSSFRLLIRRRLAGSADRRSLLAQPSHMIPLSWSIALGVALREISAKSLHSSATSYYSDFILLNNLFIPLRLSKVTARLRLCAT